MVYAHWMPWCRSLRGMRDGTGRERYAPLLVFICCMFLSLRRVPGVRIRPSMFLLIRRDGIRTLDAVVSLTSWYARWYRAGEVCAAIGVYLLYVSQFAKGSRRADTTQYVPADQEGWYTHIGCRGVAHFVVCAMVQGGRGMRRYWCLFVV